MYAEYHRIFCACTKHTKPLAFLLLTAFAHNALAQWTYRVAPDPTIRSISFFINTPASGSTTLFVSTLTDGMYKVIDTGVSATSTFQKISNGLPIVQVRLHTSIDINTMYAGTDGAGLFKSIDGGANWLPLNGSVAMPLGCSNVRSFNFDVTVPRTLIVGTSCRNNSGFYKSTDDGLNWSRLGNATLPDDVGVSALNRSGNTYFLASNNYGIFKSVDAGTTWAAANTGITAPNGTLNAFNTQFNGTAPANLLTYIHGSGMYRSTDTGVTWTPSNVGLPIGFAALGGIARESSLVMYVGLDKQGVYRTIDGGVNWAAWGNTSGEVLRYSRTVATVAAGSTYYFGTLTGLAKTTDNANTHVIVGMGDSGGRINAIAHDRDTPARAYVTARDLVRIDNVYGDCSTGCSPLETGITGTTFEGVPYQDQLNPAILYVTTSNRGIFKSTDGGVSFAAINSGLPNMIGQSSRLAIDQTNSLNLYLGLSDATGVYKSTNGGATWTASNAGLSTADSRSINILNLDQNNPSIVYAATDAGLFKSTDSGATWLLKYSATDSGGSLLPVNAIRVRSGNSLELYMANNHANANGTLAPSSGIHKSIDGGDTWTNILPGQAASQVRVLTNGDIYAGISATTGNPAVRLSTNGGTSFTAYSAGLNGSDIRTFGVAADRSTVISLSLENGLYTRDLTATTTSVTTSGSPSTLGSTVTFTATVSGSGATGSVDFKADATTIAGCGAVAVVAGQAACATNGLSLGAHSITATYSGNLSFATSTSAVLSVSVDPAGTFNLQAVRSRKTHGTAGSFDFSINTGIAIGGLISVEPRTIGSSGHTIVFQFNAPVTSVGSVNSLDATGVAIGSASFAISGNDVVVTLTGIADNRRATVSLGNVNGNANVSAALGFLIGDVNNTRSVNSSDISSVKARSGQATTALNFQFDVNASGAINSSDISAVKARSGLTLP